MKVWIIHSHKDFMILLGLTLYGFMAKLFKRDILNRSF